jgi:hypothetical protein
MRNMILQVVLLILVVGLTIGWCIDHQANASRTLRVYVAMSAQLSKHGVASQLLGDKIEFSENGVDWKEVSLSNSAVREPIDRTAEKPN